YTGFCPKLPDHYGQSYGKATHQIIRERPRDLLKERLSSVRHRCRLDRGMERYPNDYVGHSQWMEHGRDGIYMHHKRDSHCMDRRRDGLCMSQGYEGQYLDHHYRNRPS
ncbi:hypothetical protein NPIL_324551, partial [Nephila pilipes]